MSNLILCKGRLSDTPYYLVGLGMNIYSIEELCYYLVKNAYILDNDIMDEKLCDYIDKELRLITLADKLRRLLKDKISLGQFVTCILSEVGYLKDDELRKIKQTLVDNASLSFSEKRKKRADNLLKANKITRAIDEYRYILQTLKKEEESEMYAYILHNLGVCYARYFSYDKAASYFKEAYDLFESKEILVHFLMAVRMTMKKEEFERFVLRMGYEEYIVSEVDERFKEASIADIDTKYSNDFETIKELKESGKISEYSDTLNKTFNRWKQEYRDQMVVRSAK